MQSRDPSSACRENRAEKFAGSRFLLRLENVTSFVVSVLQRFLNWHVLRLAFCSLPADLRGEATCPRNEAGPPQVSSRASFEISPFVAWHSGRQNSTGHGTSLGAIAFTRRSPKFGRRRVHWPFCGVAFDGNATSKPALFAPLARGAAFDSA